MIRRCLEKDVKRRQRDIADAAADLRDHTVIAERASTARPRWPWSAVAAAVIAATIGAAYFATRRHAAMPGLERAVLSQVTFDNGLTTMPALSPDGKLLVYSSDRAGRGDLDLWVEQTSGGPPIRLTDDPADDIQPSFSPDGTQIVFRSERAGGALFLMPALGGAQRMLIEGGRAPRFSPDGKHIAYWKGSWRGGATAGTGTAFTLDLSGGTPLQILAQFAGVREPVWSPDGKAVLVLGREKLSQPADLYWVRADNSGALRTGALDDEMRADIERVTSSAGVLGTWTKSGVLLSARSGLWMLPISASNGQLTGAAKRLTVGAGEYLFSTADDTGAIVFASIVSTRVIERAPVTHSGTATVLWSDSSGAASRPSQTPDGSHVLYERRGPGYYDLWIRVGTSPDRLVFRAPSRGANPVISPDGSMVAYTVLKPNSARDGEAFAIAGAGGVPQRICSDCMAWGFLSNNRSILIQDGEFKRLRAVDVHTGDSRVILETPKSMDRPHVSPDERHIAFNFDGKQWIAPVYADQPTPQPQWQQVREHTVGGRACGWSLDSQTAYLLLDTDGFRCLWGQRVDAKTGNLVGEPFAVRHFHSTIEQEFSTSVGNAISTAGFIYGGGRLKANLWRLTLPR